MATQYRYLLADLLTNQILAELSFTNVNFTQQLNTAGSFTGDLLLSGVNSKALNVLNATIPGRTAIYVDRSGALVWGGIVWGREYDSSNQHLKISAREFESYFERRRITTNLSYTNIDQLALVDALVEAAQSAPSGNIGITVPITNSITTSTIINAVTDGTKITYTTSAINYFVTGQTVTVIGIQSPTNPGGVAGNGFNTTGTITTVNPSQFTITSSLADVYTYGGSATNQGVIIGSQSYYYYELKTYFNAISDLAKSNTGFDFNIKVSYDSGGNIVKTLQLGYPRLGNPYSTTSTTVPTFILPAGNILQYNYKEDGTKAANSVYASGAGSNEGKLIANITDPTKIGSGWPLLEDSTNYSNVTDISLLTNFATGQVLATSYPPQTLQIAAPPYVDPVFGTYNLGDQARVVITDPFYPTEFDGNYRIIGLNVSPGENGPERVTLTLTTTTN